MSLDLTDKEVEDFWSDVYKKSEKDCWKWCGTQSKGGYGIFSYRSTTLFCHRIAFELLVCPIPESKPELDHYCHVRNCVNPSHMLPTDRSGNMRTRRKYKQKIGIIRQGDVVYLPPQKDVIELRKNHCNKNHKIKYLKVYQDGKCKCLDCIENVERFDLRFTNDKNKTYQDPDMVEFKNDITNRFGIGIVKQAIRAKLFLMGINTYGKRTQQCIIWIEKYSQHKTINYECLSTMFDISIEKTLLKKIPELHQKG